MTNRSGIFLSAFLLHSALLTAGVVTLKNGDRITGNVKSLQDGVLAMTTSYAGKIEIKFNQIDSLESGLPVLVTFTSGQTLKGTVSLAESQATITADRPRLVTRSQIDSIKEPPESGGNPGLLEDWHGSADLGYSIARGNTEVNNLATTLAPQRTTENDRIIWRFQAFRNRQNRQAASNLYQLTFRYDRFLSPRTFVFLTSDAEKDGQQDLILRTREGGGFGFRPIHTDDTQLSLLGGATLLQERFAGFQREVGTQGIASVEFETRLLHSLRVFSRARFLPLLNEQRYLTEWDAQVRIPVFGGLTVGIQLYQNYDSRPKPGNKNNDMGLHSTLGYTF